jgi:hypothetical protein
VKHVVSDAIGLSLEGVGWRTDMQLGPGDSHRQKLVQPPVAHRTLKIGERPVRPARRMAIARVVHGSMSVARPGRGLTLHHRLGPSGRSNNGFARSSTSAGQSK